MPAYNTLVEVSREVNADFAAAHGADAERLGSIDRVTAERHGAIRVGSAARAGPGGARVRRLRDVPGRLLRPAGRVEELGPGGLHGLPAGRRRRAGQQPVPGLHLDARRRRPALLRRGDPSAAGGLRRCPDPVRARAARAGRPVVRRRADSAPPTPTGSSTSPRPRSSCQREPVDHDWYFTLERISAVAADIGGVPSTHINHLTPRVLDIDDLYAADAGARASR